MTEDVQVIEETIEIERDDDAQLRLVDVSIEELVHTLALKRQERRVATQLYSRTGSLVKTLREDEERITAELERRDEIAQRKRMQTELPFEEAEDGAVGDDGEN